MQRPGGRPGLDTRKEQRGSCGLGQWGRVGSREVGSRDKPPGLGQDCRVQVKKVGREWRTLKGQTTMVDLTSE